LNFFFKKWKPKQVALTVNTEFQQELRNTSLNLGYINMALVKYQSTLVNMACQNKWRRQMFTTYEKAQRHQLWTDGP